MNYKGYTINQIFDSPYTFEYYKGASSDGQKCHHGDFLNDIAAEIDELTDNDPSSDEPAGILLTSLKEMVAEFKKPEWEIWCDHSVGICACGPIRILERAESAIKWAAALESNPSVITDKLKIAVQCIEACKEEFAYFHGMRKIEAAPAQAMIKLCNNALKAIQE